MIRKIKLLLSEDYENDLLVEITAEVSDSKSIGTIFITDISLCDGATLNDLLDYVSEFNKKQALRAYASACILCGKPKETAIQKAKDYEPGIKTFYQLIEESFINRLKDELQKDK